jgi:hypothetical protein
MYKLINPPIFKRRGHMTSKEAELYFSWFNEAYSERLKILKVAIEKESIGLKTTLNFSKDSLIIVEKWFRQKVEMRERTEKELEKEKKYIEESKISHYVPTDVTISICFDISLYFAESLKKYVDGLNWQIDNSRKDSVSFHEPVLTKGKVQIDTFLIISTFAYSIVRGRDKSLQQLHDAWIEILNK